MNNIQPWATDISPLVAENYRRIQTRIAELKHYHFLQPNILEFLKNPALTINDHHWQASSEKLAANGLISDVPKFLDYRNLIAKQDRPLSFLTAPGSRIHDHHSYPGGLVLHTAADIEFGLGMARVYEEIYHLEIDKEILIVALTLHDIAKVSVYPWNSQGEYPDEIQIAGTGCHHILSISEAIRREFPLPIIKAMAFCHNRVVPPETGLKRFLEAAYLLADLAYPEDIELRIQLEDWLCLLADSDWPLSSWAMKQNISHQPSGFHPLEFLYLLSRQSEFHIFKGE
jgi:hypothetical protein